MIDPLFTLVVSGLAGCIGGFFAAAIFIISRQRFMDEQALILRKASRRLESARKLESARLAALHTQV